MFNKFILPLCSIVLLVGCKKDDNNSPDENPKGGNILLQTNVDSPDGTTGVSYLQLLKSLEGSIDNSNAQQIPIAESANFYGNTMYSFDAGHGDSKDVITAYQYDPATATLHKGASLKLPTQSMSFSLIKVSDSKAYVPHYGIGEVTIVNPQTMQKTGSIDLKPYSHSDNNPEASYGIVRGNYFYLPLHQVVKQYQPYDDYLQVDVAVIDTRTDKVVKVLSEKSSGLLMATRPTNEGMIFTDEQGDIHIACTGYFGLNPAHKQNGFVCIPAVDTISDTTFDTARTWDISQTTIAGTAYQPASIYNCQYIGNGKVVAYVALAELVDAQNSFTSKNALAVLMDLKAKTITPIAGVPYSVPFATGIFHYGNKVALASLSTERVGFYLYDPATGKANFALSTVGVPTVLHQF